MTDYIETIAWNEQGLVPAIAQDASSGRILMMAWMNRESLRLTIEQNVAVYFSRSRQKLWRKGESSGHTQIVKEIRLDCDADMIVMQVEQIGGIACHTGRESCLYRVFKDNEWVVVDDVIKPSEDIYNAK